MRLQLHKNSPETMSHFGLNVPNNWLQPHSGSSEISHGDEYTEHHRDASTPQGFV